LTRSAEKFRAHVDSVQAGSGAAFSLLPPENATGNYVKVVQRVPVKILFDEPLPAGHTIGPGLSVTPDVRVSFLALPEWAIGCWLDFGRCGQFVFRSVLNRKLATCGVNFPCRDAASSGLASAPQPVAGRAGRDAGDVHAGARHLHRQHRPAAHRRQPVGATTDQATWVLTSYLVANAIILPMTGWLGNHFGRKRVFISCIGMFTFASALCGWREPADADSGAHFAGAGGGAMVPIAQAILLESFPAQKRGAAMATFAQGVVVAPDHRPDARRLDHGQLFVALDFLHQPAGRHAGDVPGGMARGGPALHQAQPEGGD
jgi:hypothetical protein